MSNSQKIIRLHIENEQERDIYIERLRSISRELKQIADEHGEDCRTVLADLTYIVVGDDIISVIQSEGEGDWG